MIETAITTAPARYVGQKMYEYITSQSNIVQASIDILYIPKANGRTKGTMPIIKRMFQIRFFFMGFSKIERCKANLLNNFIHQRVTEHKYLPTASCSSCFSAYASIFLRKTARDELPYIREVLTLSKIQKQSFRILKHGSKS
jgi:hypothetical protein